MVNLNKFEKMKQKKESSYLLKTSCPECKTEIKRKLDLNRYSKEFDAIEFLLYCPKCDIIFSQLMENITGPIPIPLEKTKIQCVICDQDINNQNPGVSIFTTYEGIKGTFFCHENGYCMNLFLLKMSGIRQDMKIEKINVEEI